jgi:hypothetical protein
MRIAVNKKNALDLTGLTGKGGILTSNLTGQYWPRVLFFALALLIGLSERDGVAEFVSAV